MLLFLLFVVAFCLLCFCFFKIHRVSLGPAMLRFVESHHCVLGIHPKPAKDSPNKHLVCAPVHGTTELKEFNKSAC